MKTFKRALSSILAFVMVLTTLTVMNVTNTFADVSATSSDTYVEWAFGKTTNITTDVLDTTFRNVNGSLGVDPTFTSSGSKFSTKQITATDFSWNGIDGTAYNTANASSSNRYYAIKMESTTELTLDTKLSSNPGFESYDLYVVHGVVGSSSRKLKFTCSDTNDTITPAANEAATDTVAVTTAEGLKSDTITITRDGSESALFYVGVKYNASQSTEPSVAITTSELKLAAGKTGTVSSTVQNGEGTVTYTSDNESVATVDNNGTVTGVSAGTANIKAHLTIGETTYDSANSCAVTVNANGTITISSDTNGYITVSDGTNSYTNNSSVDGFTSLTVTATANEGYKLKKLTVNGVEAESPYTIVVNGDIVINAEFEENIEPNCSYWFDTADSTNSGSYDLAGGTLVLMGDFALWNRDGYTVTDYYGTNHSAYRASNGLGSDDYKASSTTDTYTGINADSLVAPAVGNAFSFTPNKDGSLTVYGATASGKSYSVHDTVNTNEAKNDTNGNAAIPLTIDVKAGTTYYVFANSSTGNTALIGFEFVYAKDPIIQKTSTNYSATAVYDNSIGANEAGAYYVISVVSNSDAAINDSTKDIGQAINESVYAQTGMIYRGVEINGKVYTAADLGGAEGDWVWAVKITGATGEGDVEIIKRIITMATTAAAA